MAKIYLDWASTSPPLSDSRTDSVNEKQFCGNASSIHTFGRESNNSLTEARNLLAECTGVKADEVYFTSGATEANNMIVFSFLKKLLLSPSKSHRPHIVISHIEHVSLWEPVQALSKTGFDISVAEPGITGIVAPEAITALCTKNTVCVFLMLCNNETGAIQPVKETVHQLRKIEALHKNKIHIHTDAVQIFGKLWFSFTDLGVDSASVSAHKIGGPKGTGALLLKKTSRLEFLYCGGGQESGIRPGTENVHSIQQFAQCAKQRITTLEENLRNAGEIMDSLAKQADEIQEVHLVPESRLDVDSSMFSPYILSLSIPPIPSEVLVRSLDEHGIAVSAGSACNLKTKKKQRRVLRAMNISKEISESAIRISIGPETTGKEIDTFISTLKNILPLLLHLAQRIKKPQKRQYI